MKVLVCISNLLPLQISSTNFPFDYKVIKKSGSESFTKMNEMDWMDVFETKKTEVQILKAEMRLKIAPFTKCEPFPSVPKINK